MTRSALAPTWAPPAPAHEVPAIFPDTFEVRLFSTLAGLTLVAAIALIVQRNELSSIPQPFFPGLRMAHGGDAVPPLAPFG